MLFYGYTEKIKFVFSQEKFLSQFVNYVLKLINTGPVGPWMNCTAMNSPCVVIKNFGSRRLSSYLHFIMHWLLTLLFQVLALIPDEVLRKGIASEMSGQNNSVERWNLMSQRIDEFLKTKRFAKTSTNILNEIMLQVKLFLIKLNSFG